MATGCGVAIICSLAAAGSPISNVAAGTRTSQPVVVLVDEPPSARRLDFRLVGTKAAPRPDFTFTGVETAPAQQERWTADLVAAERISRLYGSYVRRQSMVAGVSLRFTNADGTLAPEVGMSGPAGRALTRLALEAADF